MLKVARGRVMRLPGYLFEARAQREETGTEPGPSGEDRADQPAGSALAAVATGGPETRAG